MIVIKRSAIGTAPGKLDFLGGFASRESDIVLQSQTQCHATVLVTESPQGDLSVSSTTQGKFETGMSGLLEAVSSAAEPARIVSWFDGEQVPRWARQILGCAIAFAHKLDWRPSGGLAFAVSSDVPVGIGLGSSSALQIATLRALEKLSGRYFEETEMAEAASQVGSDFLQEPSAIMHQLTSAYGRPGCLLPVHCFQPRHDPPLALPKGATVVALQSSPATAQIRRAYENVCNAAAIGWQAVKAAGPIPQAISPSYFECRLRSLLSDATTATQAASALKGQISLPFELAPETCYMPRSALAFAIWESYRCRLAIHLLATMTHNTKRKVSSCIGELMLQSHQAYRRLGLTSPRTDRIVSAIAQAGPESGLFGARISASGEGNAIAALADKKAVKTLRQILLRLGENSEGDVAIIQ